MKSIGILRRRNGADSWNLISFVEVVQPVDRARIITKAYRDADGWRHIFGGDFDVIVAEIEANMCSSVNNHDGFRGVKPL